MLFFIIANFIIHLATSQVQTTAVEVSPHIQQIPNSSLNEQYQIPQYNLDDNVLKLA